LHEFKIYIDRRCEMHNLLLPIAADEFTNFDNVNIDPGAVYVIGRDEIFNSLKKVKHIIDNKIATIVFSNPTEGSSTMYGQFERYKIWDLARTGQLLILTGGNIDSCYRYIQFEQFLHSITNFEENIQCMRQIEAIYSKKEKPYLFLMLNGRMRPHRRWMIESFRQAGLLDKILYTNLHAKHEPCSDLRYMINGADVMHNIEPIHYLPSHYEIDKYQSQINVSTDNIDVKHHLFNGEWGEVYIKAEPYIDTYFSVVTETIYNSSHSFRTEKIWKPIMIGHPWICVSNPGFYKDLRNMGFQTFNTLIDEDFDLIENTQDRLERLTVVVQNLCSSNLSDFLLQCNSICKYNQQHMLEYKKHHVDAFQSRFINFLKENMQ